MQHYESNVGEAQDQCNDLMTADQPVFKRSKTVTG